MEEMKASGVTVISLLALADGGKPYYDESTAKKLASLDIPCFACNPQKLPQLLNLALNGQTDAVYSGQWTHYPPYGG